MRLSHAQRKVQEFYLRPAREMYSQVHRASAGGRSKAPEEIRGNRPPGRMGYEHGKVVIRSGHDRRGDCEAGWNKAKSNPEMEISEWASGEVRCARQEAMRHGKPVLGEQPRREALIMTLRKILRDTPPGKRIVVGRVLLEAIVQELEKK